MASRAAAEEVYEKARDKVNRMGGVGAMRERERERSRGGMGWGWDEGKRGGGEGEREEREGGGDGEGDGEEEGEEGEAGYTMDLMLRSLNIELGVIGFDAGGQRWVD